MAKESGGTVAPGAGQGDPGVLLQQGIEQGQAGKADEAKATFEKVVALQGDNKFAWFNLGYLAQSRGLASEAVASYDKVLEIDGSYRPAMFNKAILLEGEKPEEALALYRKIVDADKAASTAYLRLGLMLDKRNDQQGARTAFTSAVAVDGSLASSVPAKYRPRKPAR
ncbi:tetratricopeptide repeat protein [Micromonospora sp. NPDC005298]|uniref:tetratricopeptide repeat protein n=1 Tax=Micromonospora sp. NPDC005298 TaxID=3156873 RepID=UPI0033BDE304